MVQYQSNCYMFSGSLSTTHFLKQLFKSSLEFPHFDMYFTFLFMTDVIEVVKIKTICFTAASYSDTEWGHGNPA